MVMGEFGGTVVGAGDGRVRAVCAVEHRHYIVFFPTFVRRDKGERVDPQRKDRLLLKKHLIQIFQE